MPTIGNLSYKDGKETPCSEIVGVEKHSDGWIVKNALTDLAILEKLNGWDG